jgi:multicomponent Na+:H+ antiporter subunit G
MSVVEIVGAALLVLGAAVFAVAGVGVVRLPDLYTRVSAVTTAAGLGVSLIVLGVLLHNFDAAKAVKAVLAIVVNLATAAVGGHALGRAGYLTGVPLASQTRYDELADER